MSTTPTKAPLSQAEKDIWKQFFRIIEPRGWYKEAPIVEDAKLFKMACSDFRSAIENGKTFECMAHYDAKVKNWLLSNQSRAPVRVLVDGMPRCENGFLDIV